MADPVTTEDFYRRPQQYLHVQQKTSVLEIVCVKLDLYGNRQFVTSMDLRPSCQAGRNEMATLLLWTILCEVFHE